MVVSFTSLPRVPSPLSTLLTMLFMVSTESSILGSTFLASLFIVSIVSPSFAVAVLRLSMPSLRGSLFSAISWLRLSATAFSPPVISGPCSLRILENNSKLFTILANFSSFLFTTLLSLSVISSMLVTIFFSVAWPSLPPSALLSDSLTFLMSVAASLSMLISLSRSVYVVTLVISPPASNDGALGEPGISSTYLSPRRPFVFNTAVKSFPIFTSGFILNTTFALLF